MSSIKQKLSTQSIEKYAEGATKIYGTEVLENRAVPDYRDGLKPVQRAILWSMYNLNLHHKGPFKKAARTVGETIGSYHPRGDQPCYQAMVGIANTPIAMVDGYGNWGSHVDEAAAPRYCFVAGTKVMTEFGLINIESIPKILGHTENPTILNNIFTEFSVSSITQASIATKWLYSGKHQTKILKTKLGYSTQCSSNQPFLVLDSNLDYVWKTVDELSIGDAICIGGGSGIDYTIKSKLGTSKASLIALLTKAVLKNGKGLFLSDYREDRFEQSKSQIENYLESESIQYTVLDDEFKNSKYKFEIESDSNLFDEFGLFDWNEYTSYIPKCIFESSYDEALAFTQSLFLTYAKVIGTDLYLSMRSHLLIDDTKQFLLNYFNVITEAEVESDNGFLLIKVPDIEFAKELKLIPEQISIQLKKVHAANKLSQRKIYHHTKIPHVKEWLNNKYIEALVSGKFIESELQKIRSFSEYSNLLNNQVDYTPGQESDIVNKLITILDNYFTYDIITSIEDGGLQDVFDLTVDKTHAFYANGFVAHNTEARLSEFSDRFLLDPEYLAAVEMRPNYSEDKMLPTILPAKVPNVLLTGNTSIAVGISASSPPFELKGVLHLTKLCLEGTKLKPEHCLKYLRFNYRYGGTCVSTDEELLAYYKTGVGSLYFQPSYEASVLKREFVITSTCPGMSSENTISSTLDKISNISGVKLVHDSEDKDGIKYITQFGKIGDDKIKSGFEEIKKLITKREKFDFGVVERNNDQTKFFRASPIKLIEKWCIWRIELEKTVISNRIAKAEAQLESLKLFVLAVDNLTIILESLKKDDSEKYLVQKLKITPEQAAIIMDMKLKQLKRMEKKTLLEKIKKEQAAIKSHKIALKNPSASIIESFNDVKKLI